MSSEENTTRIPGWFRTRMFGRLSQLEPEKNPEIRLAEEWKSFRKRVILVVAAGLAVLVLCVIMSLQENAKVTEFTRSDYSEGDQSYDIRMSRGGEEEDISVVIPKGDPTEEDWEKAFLSAVDYAQQVLDEEGASVSESDVWIDLPENCGEAVYSWKSRDPEYVSDYGRVYLDKIPDEGIEVEVEADIDFYEWWDTEVFVFRIEKSGQSVSEELSTYIDGQKGSTVKLPTSLGGEAVSFYEESSSWILKGAIFAVLLIVVVLLLWENTWQKAVDSRTESLSSDYPGFLSRFLAYIQAGASIPAAWDRVLAGISEDRYLAREMRITGLQIRAGRSPESAWEAFGERCGLAGYRRCASLFSQANRKGGDMLVRSLEEELTDYYQHEKNEVRKKGQENATKLLGPTGVIFAALMIAMCVPALMSMSF